jgi:hypothetical protein
MKIRFKKNVVVDVKKSRLDEVWDKQYRKWDELRVDNVVSDGAVADLFTYEGDILQNVPTEAFEVVK